MNSGEFCSALYGSRATSYHIDLLKNKVMLSVARTDGKGAIEVEFHTIRMLGWACDEPTIHEQLDLSVVGLERGDDGVWKVYFNPWDSAELEFECDRITADGDEVMYTGDCFEG
ncbi:MAG: hypothetical protein ABI679_00505 [Gemmatimonadota bacterium]